MDSDENIGINQEYTTELIEVLCSVYQPASTPQEADEMLTTADLVEQISDFVETSKDVIYEAMQSAGFKIHYTGSGYVWLLKHI